MLGSSKSEYNLSSPCVSATKKMQTDSTEKSSSCALAIIVMNRRERINLPVWNRVGDGHSIRCVIPVTLQHFLSLSRRGTLCLLFVTLQNLMRASMFRSKFSILLSISYDETNENVAGIIIRATKKLRATLFLITDRSTIDKSTNNKLLLKYVAQILSAHGKNNFVEIQIWK